MTKCGRVLLLGALALLLVPSSASAQTIDATVSAQWLAIGAIPILLAVATSFAKFTIVFGALRFGLGVEGVPSALVVAAFSAVLSSFVMGPVVVECTALFPESMPSSPAATAAIAAESLAPWKAFLEANTNADVLRMLLDLRGSPVDGHASAEVLLTAFAITELQEALAIVVLVLLPFIVLDVVIAATLQSAGLGSLPPQRVAPVLKVLLFLSIGGFAALSKNLVVTYAYGVAG